MWMKYEDYTCGNKRIKVLEDLPGEASTPLFFRRCPDGHWFRSRKVFNRKSDLRRCSPPINVDEARGLGYNASKHLNLITSKRIFAVHPRASRSNDSL